MGESSSARLSRGPGGAAVLFLVGVAVVTALAVFGLWWWPASPGEEGELVEEFMHIHGLDIPGWDADAVYVSTHQGLVRIDEEGSWRWVGEQRHDFMGFTAHPTEKGVLYSSGHPGSGSDLPNPIGFMVSEDGGQTWQPRELTGQADFHTMATGPDGEVVYGWNGAGEAGLYRSRDGGHSWEQARAEALHQLGGALSLAVSPHDAEEVWAGTEAGLLRSDDAGDTWEPVHAPGPVTAVALDRNDADRALAYLATPDHGLVATDNGGDSWEPLGLTLEDDAVFHVTIHPSDAERVYVGTGGQSLLRSRDGGQTWETLARSGEPEEG